MKRRRTMNNLERLFYGIFSTLFQVGYLALALNTMGWLTWRHLTAASLAAWGIQSGLKHEDMI